jgi:Predicted nucleotide-binding protein containing TIR-like domain
MGINKNQQRPFPNHSLSDAVHLAEAIQNSNNGRPFNRLLLANAMGRRPLSSDFRMLLSSGVKYGLTFGNEKSELIGLTELGIAITRPRNPAERIEALRKALLPPELFKRVYDRYSNGKLPRGEFFLTVLERDFAVPRERCPECAEMLVTNGKFVGIVRELQNTLYVVPDSAVEEPTVDVDEGVAAGDEPRTGPDLPEVSPAVEIPSHDDRFIFVGHGKNKKPLEQLKKVLDQFKIAHKVAIEEPQGARPISVKVAQVMKECHSAVLIFTADEEFRDSNGEVIWRPSENVIYELGAAAVLYENRIVIFKEEGIDFPTNFRDIGHISFEKDKLDAKGLDLVRELIALGLLKVQAA